MRETITTDRPAAGTLTEPESLHTETNGRTRVGDGLGVGVLLRDLTRDMSKLFRQEIELAKAEMREKVAQTIRNVVYVYVGMCVAYAGLLALVAAASIGAALALEAAGLEGDLAAWIGPAGVGLVLLLVGWAAAQKGATTLKHESLNPKKTKASLQATSHWAREKVR